MRSREPVIYAVAGSSYYFERNFSEAKKFFMKASELYSDFGMLDDSKRMEELLKQIPEI